MFHELPKSEFRAFISYSHKGQKDPQHAKWLQRSLERYVFPRELVGVETKRGVIGRKLGRFFLDREDLPAGSPLSEEIINALKCSESLIVLCSYASGKSKYVHAEIAYFKSLGRAPRNIFPVIVDSDPEFTLSQTFPELAGELPTESALLDVATEAIPIAADLRPDRDGKELAKLKIISGMVGIPLGVLRQRELVAERRRRRLWAAAAVTSASLAVVAIISSKLAVDNGRLAQDSQRRAEENLVLAEQRFQKSIDISASFLRPVVAESDQLGIPSDKALGFLKAVEATVNELSKEAPGSLALKEVKAEINLATCDIYEKLGELVEWEQRAKKAEAAFDELIALQPDRALHLAERLGKATYQIGLALKEQGYLGQGQVYFLQTRDIRRKLVAISPAVATKYSTLTRDLSAAYLMIGEGYRDLGAFAEALTYFRDTLSLREALARQDPDNYDRRQDVAMALVGLGDLHLFLSNVREADLALTRGTQIRHDLFKSKPENIFAKRRYGWGLAHLARLRLEQGALSNAASAIAKAVELMEQVRASDSKNVISQADFAWFVGYRGQIAKSRGSQREALADFERAANLLEDLLAKHAVTHMGLTRGAAYWTYHRAVTLGEAGRLDDALRHFDRAISHLMTTTTSDQTNAVWRAELASNLIGKAWVLGTFGRRAERLDALKRAQAALSPMFSALPPDFVWSAMLRDVNSMVSAAESIILAEPAGFPLPTADGR